MFLDAEMSEEQFNLGSSGGHFFFNLLVSYWVDFAKKAVRKT